MSPAIRMTRPRWYPHWGWYCYTPRGFDRRVRPRLLALGLKEREVARLRQLYFDAGCTCHHDETGAYRNYRRYRLYALSRSMHYDRKCPLLQLVRRSGLFWVWEDEDDGLVAFLSPFAAARRATLTV